MRTVTTPEVPRICVVLDAVLAEAEKAGSGFSNRKLAKAIGVSDAAVGRWRKGAEPSRDHVLAIERYLKKRPGYIAELAGYSEPDESNDIPTLIRRSNRYSEPYRRVLLRVEAEAALGTQEERANQAAWAKQRRN